jgi:septal ring factor EnvC (AmiA/AmiB activator)
MAVFAAIAIAAGCEHSKQRTVNVASGEYYSEDEMALLPPGSLSRYCDDLGSVRTATQQEFESKTQELAVTNDKITAATAQRTSLDRERVGLEAEIRTLQDQISEVKALPDSVEVRIGESLETIAALSNVYNDPSKWWKLFEANKKIILDPFYCLADTVIFIPRNWPTD